MSSSSSIQWTDSTWNPTRGCSRVSEGCRNCYAERQAIRFSGPGKPYHGLVESSSTGPKWTGRVLLDRETLGDPLRWTTPRRIFVDSMSDLFHPGITFDEVDAVVAVMGLARRHTFQVLTKRPERLVAYLRRSVAPVNFLKTALYVDRELAGRTPRALPSSDERVELALAGGWPPPNVWWGTSAENQATVEERLPKLLEAPTGNLFASIEPLLEQVNLQPYVAPRSLVTIAEGENLVVPGVERPRLAWVIVGGESGPGSRPCNVRWVRDVVVRCGVAGVPVFVKQLGRRVLVANDRLSQFPDEDQLHVVAGQDVAVQGHDVELRLFDSAGGEPSEWPEDLRVRELPAGMIGAP